MATAAMDPQVLLNLTWQVIQGSDKEGNVRWWLQGLHPSGGHCCFIDLRTALDVEIRPLDKLGERE